jgi:hypothetical protein
MTLGLSTCITHMHNKFGAHKRQIIISNDTTNNLKPGVAQATMPLLCGESGGTEAHLVEWRPREVRGGDTTRFYMDCVELCISCADS